MAKSSKKVAAIEKGSAVVWNGLKNRGIVKLVDTRYQVADILDRTGQLHQVCVEDLRPAP